MSAPKLQEYVDKQSERRPDATALVYEKKSITYGELAFRTNQLARLLQDSGCRPGDRVGILLPKSIDAIVGILATLKAGCIYVPMDVASPMVRLQMMQEACEARILLAGAASGKIADELVHTTGRHSQPLRIGWLGTAPEGSIPLAFCPADLSAVSGAPLPEVPDAADVAHILFTSGSTGRPKGVMITHDNVRSFVEWAIQFFGHSASDKISGHPPLHFDLSTFDIYGTFAAGAQLHLVPAHVSLLPHKLAQFIRESELTQWFSVPSLLNYMAKFDVVAWDDFPALRRLLWCGEKFPTPGLIHWMRRLPHVTFTNLYGPTEATIASSYYRVLECPKDPEQPIPIGTACAGEELFILNADLNPLPPGEIGDLYIGGVGLSPGYWRDPEKTARAFVQNPFTAEPERIYHTGDLASWAADGLVYIHGRTDSQIKSRGYRIELGEIEAALHATNGVRECAVIAIDTGDFNGSTICCALVPAAETEVHLPTVRTALSDRLPNYMIPSRWICLDALPLNANGKVDRPKLKQSFELAKDCVA